MNENDLFSLLARCCDGSSLASQQTAMKQLEGLDSAPAPGYVSSLVQIIQRSGSVVTRVECRQLAVISLKNVVDKCWVQRNNVVIPVSEAEKDGLREFLLAYWFEPDRKVAVQLSSLTAKIAYKDWPTHWPSLLPTIFQACTTNSSELEELCWMQQTRAISTLDIVLKELSKKSLPAAKKELLKVCAEMFLPLATIWNALLSQLSIYLTHVRMSIVACQEQQHAILIPKNQQHERLAAFLSVTTKVLCKVTQHGLTILSKESGVLAAFFDVIVAQLPSMVQFLRLGNSALAAAGSYRGDGGDDNDDSGYSMDECDGDDGDDEDEQGEVDRNASSTLKYLVSSVAKIVRQVSRLPPALQKQHPLELAPYLGPFLKFYYDQLIDEYVSNGSGRMGRPTTLQALYVSSILFLSNTLQCRDYSTVGVQSAKYDSLRSKEVLREMLADKIDSAISGEAVVARVNTNALVASSSLAANQGAAAKLAFFTPECISSILDLVLHRLLCYSISELEEWENNPEQFVLGQDSINEGDTIKSTAEMFVTVLLDTTVCPCAQLVAQQLISHLNNLPMQLEAVKPDASEENVVLWDAVFLCTGLGNFALGGQINADEWLMQVIAPLLTALLISPTAGALRSGQQLLRARLLWLLKSWLYLFDPSVFGQLVCFLVLLLEPASGSDVVSCVEAVRLIEYMVDSTHFRPESFVPVLLRLFESLCALTVQLEDRELQAPVVLLMSKIVDAMGSHIIPLLQPLSIHLASLWTSSDQESPVRSSILDCVTQMVKAVGGASSSLQGITLPLLTFTMSSTEDSSFLFKEGLALLLAVMRNCSSDSYTDALDGLLSACLHCCFEGECACDPDDLLSAMYICEAYCVINGTRTMFTSGNSIGKALLRLIGQVAPRNVTYLMRPLEALFLSSPADAGRYLLETGLLLNILRICAASTPQFQDILEKHREEDIALVAYLSIFARLLLCEPMTLVSASQLLSAEILSVALISKASAISTGALVIDHHVVLASLIRLMIDKFDCVGYSSAGVWRRKLWCLALLSLYPQTDVVREWFPEVCEIAVDVNNEASSEEGNSKVSMLARSLVGMDEDGMDSGYADSDDDEVNEDNVGQTERSVEPIIDIYDRMIQQDVVMATNISILLESKRASLAEYF